MSCPRCEADPRPANFGSPRQCAFDASGHFTPDNWNCATLSRLLDGASCANLTGSDETLEAVYSSGGWHGGWLVLTRYKRRGCTSSAVHVGDFYPPRVVTLALVEQFIAGGDDYVPDDMDSADLAELAGEGKALPARFTPVDEGTAIGSANQSSLSRRVTRQGVSK